MKSTVGASNKYVSTVADGSSIDSVAESGTFEVTSASKEGYSLPSGAKKYFLILDYGTANEEIFRITNRTGTTLTWDKRLSYPNGKKSHAAGSSVQLNDVSELVNEIAANVDDFGFVEEVPGASPAAVTVSGGLVHAGAADYPTPATVAGDTFAVGATSSSTLTDNVLNNIVFSYATGVFEVVQTASLAATSGFLIATVQVTAGAIVTITDKRGVSAGSAILAGKGASAGNVPVWNGTDWEPGTPVDALPSQATHSGKVLTTDGTNLSWTTNTSGTIEKWGILEFAGTGVQAVTGLGFQPIRFEFVATMSVGAGDAAQSHSYVSVADLDGVAYNIYLTYVRSVSASINTEFAVSEFAGQRIVHLRWSTVANYVKINSADADGFTVECDTYNSPFKVFYKAYSA